MFAESEIMADSKLKTEPMAGPVETCEPLPAFYQAAVALLLVGHTLCLPPVCPPDHDHSTIMENHMVLEWSPFSETAVAVEAESEPSVILDLKHAPRVEARSLLKSPHVQPEPSASRGALVLALALPLASLVALGSLGLLVKRRLESVKEKQAESLQRLEGSLAEDPTVAAFYRELRHALHTPDGTEADGSPEGDLPRASDNSTKTPADPVEEYLTALPARLTGLRLVLSEISAAANEATRLVKVLEFIQQMEGMRTSARPPELRPVWLLASALEGLFKQLSSNAAETSPSVLNTAGAAVDLLERLSVRGVNPNLATEPPVRLLAVDDDPVSRLAVSFALKRAFNAPDLAPAGAAALELAAQHDYDVIFLDVDMPGMDGYELCTRIHQIERHRNTPVVFVTRHGDFNSRARSTASGGEDLIAKPFLAFEITVKALTLALRGRLQGRSGKPESALSGNPAPLAASAAELTPIGRSVTPPAPLPTQVNGHTHPTPATASDVLTTLVSQTRSAVNGKSPWQLGDRAFQSLFKSTANSPEAFFSHAPAQLGELRLQLQAVQNAADPAQVERFLGELHFNVHSLTAEAERNELRAIARLSSTLEGMLKKLLDQPKHCSPSTLNAAAAALELLEELCCHTAEEPDLSNPPVSILVVDDDAVARRGVAAAIQLVFGRPEDAASGDAAVTLAQEKQFDLILLDVLMPGIDGFATCSRIHETALNRRTPVVFVTSHDDPEARSQAVAAGGCGFIPKPVLASQIKLTALTHILRFRLSKPEPAHLPEPADCVETA